jgi:hypothetical protein
VKMKFITTVKPTPANSVSKVTFGKSSISFSRGAVEKLDIGQGNHVAFFQDEEKPNDWYFVFQSLPQQSLPVSINKFGQANIKHPNLCEALRSHFHIEKNGFSLLLGGQIKTEYGPAVILITAPLIEIKRRFEAEKGGQNA